MQLKYKKKCNDGLNKNKKYIDLLNIFSSL